LKEDSMMRNTRIGQTVGAAVLATALLGGCGERDTMTSDADDREVVQRIRQALVADTTLSPLAKNVTVQTDDDSVTLRGSVANEQERAMVAAKAKQVAPERTVENELVVASR
jgi:osmotically-inducible protein OsmY